MSTRAGKLNLDRTLWAMRRVAEPKPPPKTPREGRLRWPTASHAAGGSRGIALMAEGERRIA